ncbi:MAG: hypothetical protein JWO18_2799 [Microbacteriaceae bacterium]|nr:hypothetical protein [Microbacteriaceae bacterium]
MAKDGPWADIEKALNPNLTLDALRTLEDFEVISSVGTGAIIYSRRYGELNDLATNLKAVAVATSLGLKSIDYARKTYSTNGTRDSDSVEDQSESSHSAYIAAYRAARKHVADCEISLRTNQSVELTQGTFSAAVALERLRSGFKAAHLLYSLGLNIEGDSVSRQILEQIAWAVAASQVTSDDEIEAVSATKSISKLKLLAPYAGQLYGWLSQSVHAGVQQHRDAFNIDEDGRGNILMSWSRRPIAAQIILYLADLWVVAYEWTQREHMTRFVAVDPDTNYSVVASRPYLRYAEELIERVQAASKRFDGPEH